MSSSGLDQSESSGDGEKWMDSRENFWKCISIFSDILGMGGKGKVGVNDSQVSGSSNWVDC